MTFGENLWQARDTPWPNSILSVAVRDYDRTRALSDGIVQIDGVDPVCMTLSPEEIFFRAFRHAEFDICELSLSSFTVKTAQGNCPYVGVPAFVSRAFRHTSIYVRTDRIKKPSDLKGKKVGVPEYQLTANVWARAILEDDHGVKPSDIHWMRGGIEDAGRPEKIAIKLPNDVKLDNAPEGKYDLGTAGGRRDRRLHRRRAPPSLPKNTPNIGWLFPDPVAAAKDYFKRTGIFPIMHLVGVRRELAEQHPWLPGAVLKAFEQSKAVGAGAVERHVGHQGDAAVRRGALDGSARADGRGFLVVWRCAEPQNAGDLPASPSLARAVVAAGVGRRNVPSRHARSPSSCNHDNNDHQHRRRRAQAGVRPARAGLRTAHAATSSTRSTTA